MAPDDFREGVLCVIADKSAEQIQVGVTHFTSISPPPGGIRQKISRRTAPLAARSEKRKGTGTVPAREAIARTARKIRPGKSVLNVPQGRGH
jgi:hypothetical protein